MLPGTASIDGWTKNPFFVTTHNARIIMLDRLTIRCVSQSVAIAGLAAC